MRHSHAVDAVCGLVGVVPAAVSTAVSEVASLSTVAWVARKARVLCSCARIVSLSVWSVA